MKRHKDRHMDEAHAPPGAGRLFYAVQHRASDSADVILMPFEDVELIVCGVVPWDGMEDDIRARYYAWCDSAEVIKPGKGVRQWQ